MAKDMRPPAHGNIDLDLYFSARAKMYIFKQFEATSWPCSLRSSSSRDNMNTWPLSLRPSPHSIGIYTYFNGLQCLYTRMSCKVFVARSMFFSEHRLENTSHMTEKRFGLGRLPAKINCAAQPVCSAPQTPPPPLPYTRVLRY